MGKTQILHVLKDSKLFDGVEKDFYDQEFLITTPCFGNFKFKADTFLSFQGTDFESLCDTLKKEDFDYIIDTGGFRQHRTINSRYYKSEEHLSLTCFIQEGMLFVFTYGEKQPSRWILTLEGVWKIKE